MASQSREHYTDSPTASIRLLPAWSWKAGHSPDRLQGDVVPRYRPGSCSSGVSAKFSSPPQDVPGILALILFLVELSDAAVVTVF